MGGAHRGGVQMRIQERGLQSHGRRVHPGPRTTVIAAGLSSSVMSGCISGSVVRRRAAPGVEQAWRTSSSAAEVFAGVALHQLVRVDAAVGWRPLTRGHPGCNGVLDWEVVVALRFDELIRTLVSVIAAGRRASRCVRQNCNGKKLGTLVKGTSVFSV